MNLLKTFAFGALVTVFVTGCFTAHQSEPNEPVCQGKRLSQWLRDFDNSSEPQIQAAAAEAVRHIGAPAVPFLVERLSEAQTKQFNLAMQKWRRQQTAGYSIPRPPDPRFEAFAGLDALGSEGAAALPALEKLLHEDPPDPRAIYIAARMGPASLPLLTRSLTSKEKLVRLEAQICLEMLNSHSELLYPRIPTGPDTPSLNRRLCEFNLKVLQGALKEYKANHPEMDLPNGEATPSPTCPSPKIVPPP